MFASAEITNAGTRSKRRSTLARARAGSADSTASTSLRTRGCSFGATSRVGRRTFAAAMVFAERSRSITTTRTSPSRCACRCASADTRCACAGSAIEDSAMQIAVNTWIVFMVASFVVRCACIQSAFLSGGDAAAVSMTTRAAAVRARVDAPYISSATAGAAR